MRCPTGKIVLLTWKFAEGKINKSTKDNQNKSKMKSTQLINLKFCSKLNTNPIHTWMMPHNFLEFCLLSQQTFLFRFLSCYHIKKCKSPRARSPRPKCSLSVRRSMTSLSFATYHWLMISGNLGQQRTLNAAKVCHLQTIINSWFQVTLANKEHWTLQSLSFPNHN